MFAALISRTVLFAALTATATGAFGADASTNPPIPTGGFHSTVAQPTSIRQIKLPLSKSTIIDFDDEIRDILVSNPTVADAVVRSNRRLYLIGNKFGMTNVYVYGANNHQIANLEIQVEPDVSTLESLLRRLQPQSEFHIEAVVGAVVLTGSVASPTDAAQAYDVATKFLGAPASPSAPAAGAASTNVGDSVQVINGLKIRGKDQVMLRVTVAEVQRSAIKSLGIDLSTATTSGNFATALVSTNPFAVNGSTSSGSVGTLGFNAGGTSISATIRAFEQDGLMRVLSEPNLTAVSGEEANFLVGGEYPIPVAQQNGVISVDFKKYGIGLGFIPVVLSEGRISLKISTEVSEPSSTGSFSVATSSNTSFSISGLNVRRASSTVELASGATMVMAGLISDDLKQSLAGTPGLMNIPILGTLFHSRDFQRTQTELAVFVQPIIVQPVPAGRLVRPDQNFAPSSDAAAVFLGQLNRMYRASDRNPPGSYHGQYGFIYE